MFRTRFGSFFGSFFALFKPFLYPFKHFSGAISFCKRAALIKGAPPKSRGFSTELFCKFSHLFSRARKNSFFSCGGTPSRTVPKTQPLQVAFSLLERVDLRPQKFWGFRGRKNCQGKGGVDRGHKKSEKDAQKRWVLQGASLIQCLCPLFFRDELL